MHPLPALPSIPPMSNVELLEYIGAGVDWHKPSTARAAELLSRGLPPLVTLETLSFIFGVSPSLFLSMVVNKQRYYREFTIPKRNGTSRDIAAPRVVLKVVQRWILDHILARQEMHAKSFGFIRDRNIFDNAKSHLGCRYMLSLDIQDFFPSITFEMVEAIFFRIGYKFPVTYWLTELCTLNKSLPQGAPTSPCLSNLAVSGLDEFLQQWANSKGAGYSRYADDITFSSRTYKFTGEDVLTVGAGIERLGLKVNFKKVRLVGGGFRKEVTGLSVSEKILATRHRRREIRALFHNAALNPKEYASDLPRLFGLAGFVAEYDPELGARYRSIARVVRHSSNS